MSQVQSSPHVVSAFETPEWGSQALQLPGVEMGRKPATFMDMIAGCYTKGYQRPFRERLCEMDTCHDITCLLYTSDAADE